MILSIDGGKRIGWALFTMQGEDHSRGVIHADAFFDRFKTPFEIHKNFYTDYQPIINFNPEGIDSPGGFWIEQLVVEGIRHNPDINQGGSQRWESQVEGAIRLLGALSLTPVEIQPPNILPVAMLHNGYEKPVTRTGKPKHLPDQDAAWLHGRYFLTARGIL